MSTASRKHGADGNEHKHQSPRISTNLNQSQLQQSRSISINLHLVSMNLSSLLQEQMADG